MVLQCLRSLEGALDVRLHVQPGASKSGFAGLHGERLKLRLRARPVEGQANAEVVKFLAKTTSVPKSAIQIVRGLTSREKDIRILSDDPEGIAQRILDAAEVKSD